MSNSGSGMYNALVPMVQIRMNGLKMVQLSDILVLWIMVPEKTEVIVKPLLEQ